MSNKYPLNCCKTNTLVPVILILSSGQSSSHFSAAVCHLQLFVSETSKNDSRLINLLQSFERKKPNAKGKFRDVKTRNGKIGWKTGEKSNWIGYEKQSMGKGGDESWIGEKQQKNSILFKYKWVSTLANDELYVHLKIKKIKNMCPLYRSKNSSLCSAAEGFLGVFRFHSIS